MSDISLPLRKLGDIVVPAIGFGAMTITQVAGYDPDRGRRTVHAALDAGVRLFDTADVYGPAGAGDGVNELALMDALRSWPGSADDIIVATKGGHLRFPETDTWWTNGSYAHLRRACTASIQRLGLDPLPLYHHHRPDPQLPYEESMYALRALHDEGLIARVGISNVDIARIDIARSILGDALVSVQNEYSPAARTAEREIRACEERGLTFLSWGPFGGMRQAKSLGAGGSPFAEIARARGVSIHQVALAWQLHRSPAVIPIPGASRPESVRDSVAAASLTLTHEELARLDAPAETGP
ncbi:aldo/keto reductase [Nocardia flavorosea]|uniref:aldo/keto reductase n=1 Tax=Nocardia flavorosea TaxID=53429 RepID=UPI0018943163|nr:aldo/keto reductase [Nocardia flavorosea]MBF6347505.1 aldo/keto reductase [Nocardia flavorosea]